MTITYLADLPARGSVGRGFGARGVGTADRGAGEGPHQGTPGPTGRERGRPGVQTVRPRGHTPNLELSIPELACEVRCRQFKIHGMTPCTSCVNGRGPWMSSAARFAVDAAGDLCVSWADPEKGYYISKLPTSQLGE